MSTTRIVNKLMASMEKQKAKTLYSLKKSAGFSATWRGHKLDKWIDTSLWRNTGKSIAYCTNPNCYAWVQVETHPAANSIDIGGTAVALNCPVAQEE